MLRALGMQVIEHRFVDHASLKPSELEFGDDFDVLMTEKDAVKLGTGMHDRFWYVPVDLSIADVDAAPVLEQIESRIRGGRDG